MRSSISFRFVMEKKEKSLTAWEPSEQSDLYLAKQYVKSLQLEMQSWGLKEKKKKKEAWLWFSSNTKFTTEGDSSVIDSFGGDFSSAQVILHDTTRTGWPTVW